MVIWQRRLDAKPTFRRALSGRNLTKAGTAMVLLAAGGPVAYAHGVAAAGSTPASASAWSFGEAFTFLFVTLGPLNVIGPFRAMTEGRDPAFKRRVAVRGLLVATIALLVATTVGAATLRAWGVSGGALLLAAGAILFVVALRPVIAGYNPRGQRLQAATAAALPPPTDSELAFSPLAFPTIVSPYGLALLILLFSISPVSSERVWMIFGAAGLVLALDFLVMLYANLIEKIPFIDPGLDILGCVMNVLLVALGVQAITDALRIISPPTI